MSAEDSLGAQPANLEIAKGESKLKLVVGRDSSGKSLPTLVGYSTTVVGKVFNEAKPLVVTGTEEGEALGSDSVVAQNIRSIMAVPLRIRDKILGVVYLDSRLAKGLFTNDDLDFFAAISNHIAISVQLARARRAEAEKAKLEKEFEIQAAVASMAKRVQSLVDNMQQALFAIDSSGGIVEPVSKVSTNVFGTEIIGKNINDTLFANVPRNSEVFSGIQTVLATVFGEDELQWQLIEDSIPNKIDYKRGDEPRVFRVSIRPIYNEKSLIEKIMFVVEDITEVEKLEKAIKEQTEKIKILQEVAEVEKGELCEYFESSERLISEIEATNAKLQTREQLNLILVNLHTLKGNSRQFKFSQTTGLVHQCESELGRLDSEKNSFGALGQTITNQIKLIRQVIQGYKDVVSKYLGQDLSRQQVVEVPIANLDTLKASLEQLKAKISKGDYHRFSVQIENLSMPPIKVVLSRYENMIRDLSSTMGKDTGFEVKGGEFAVSKKVSQALQDSIGHLLRNSIDHGIESPAERVSVGKPPNGRIEIDAKKDDSGIRFSIKDDGRGIDPSKVAKAAISKKLVTEQAVSSMSDQEKVNLILLANFSTKEQTSEISGRGIGMDAVKTFIEAIGGSFEIRSAVGKGSEFIIEIPET